MATISLGLAPMEGITELPTRLWFGMTSRPDFATTPFLRVTRDYPAKRIPLVYCPEAITSGRLYPVTPQLMGSDSQDIIRIAKTLLETSQVVDVNCGCPAPTVVGNGGGSGWLENKARFKGLLDDLQNELGAQRVSIKLRTGFRDESEFNALAEMLSEHRWNKISLHGRTRQDKYLGHARWNHMDHLTRVSQSPVVGSGDICDFESFEKRVNEAPRVQSVIIGRGALRNPWIFNEIRATAKVTISPQALLYALATYLVLQEMFVPKEKELLDFFHKGEASLECGTDEEKWRQMFRKVCLANWGEEKNFDALEVSRGAFAKFKMLWNYMRSSLSPEFFDPNLLRIWDFRTFVEIFLQKCDLVSSTSGGLILRHAPNLDWVYSGGKNDKR